MALRIEQEATLTVPDRTRLLAWMPCGACDGREFLMSNQTAKTPIAGNIVYERQGKARWPRLEPVLTDVPCPSCHGTGEELAGVLRWHRPTHVIEWVWVPEEHRRKGIATQLLEHARTIDPKVHHDEYQASESGEAWVEARP